MDNSLSFIDFLLENKIIDMDLYELAKGKSDEESYICDILISNNEIEEDEIAKLKAKFYNLGYTELSNFSKIETIDYSSLEHNQMLPFVISNDKIGIATFNPNNIQAKNQIEYFLSLYEETKFSKFIYYVASQNIIKNKFQEISDNYELTIEKIIFDATKLNASDIHITPFDKIFQIMLRIDGKLSHYKITGIDKFEQLCIATKVLSKLDISENRRPQSGSFQQNNIDFRVSTHPTFFGENIVIRILNKDKSLISIDKIGFSKEQINYLKRICTFTNGMIIFCGPTGSGKTTSIYSLIETMDKKSKNIMTLEDPIEYKISNVKQTEIINGIINFADGVKSILRQDPDIILIGEIRDKETAQMAIRASMTGHLVLTTVHANDSFGAISRLKEFGIPTSLIAENVISVIAQRLVNKKNSTGRTIISEILKINPKIKDLICSNALSTDIKSQAHKEGFQSIFDDYKTKIDKNIVSDKDINTFMFITC